jgi:hypothetical protein
LWHNWDQRGKPWKKLLKITDQSDRDIYFFSIEIFVGDRKNTPFWESKWINGRSPRELAPKLYKSTEYKYRNVHTELKNNNWIRSFGNIQSSSLLEEFTLMFMDLSSMQLRQQKYVIKWR